MRKIAAAVFAIALLPMSLSHAQAPVQKPKFEVASIKQAVFPSDAYFAGWSDAAGCTLARLPISGNRITMSRMDSAKRPRC
jgi:hypothetical protein